MALTAIWSGLLRSIFPKVMHGYSLNVVHGNQLDQVFLWMQLTINVLIITRRMVCHHWLLKAHAMKLKPGQAG